MKHEENVTYELVPSPEHEQAWNVRILEGMYNETIIQYGAISFNEHDGEEETLSFNFEVVESPDDDLSETDEDLQEFAGKLLEHIILKAIEANEIEMKERENENTNLRPTRGR
jgi:hypothetical protein